MAALAWRRAFPLSVAALVVTTVILTDPAGEFSVLLSLVLASFTVGAEAEPPRSHVGLAVIVVPFVAASISEGLEPSDLAAALVFLVGPWAVGSMLRQRTVRTEEALARVEEAERERERQAAEAAASERTRIARELHDIVSHSISVVTIQTQAVRRRLGPDHAREAADLAAVEATAREAMAELRRLFGMLRAVRRRRRPRPTARARRARTARGGGPYSGRGRRAADRGHALPVAARGRPGGVPDPAGGAHQRTSALGGHAGASFWCGTRRPRSSSGSTTTDAAGTPGPAGMAWWGCASASRCTTAG